MPFNDTIDGGWNGDFATRIKPGTTYVNALYHEPAPVTSLEAIIEVPLDGRTIRFRGPIGDKEKLDHAKALKEKSGVVLDGASLIKDMRAGSQTIKTDYPLGCKIRATAVVRYKPDQPPNLVHLSFEPKKPKNEDDNVLCYLVDKTLWNRLKIGATVTLEGVLKYAPVRTGTTGPVQFTLGDCKEAK